MAVITSSEVINTGYAVLALVADALVFLAASSSSSPHAAHRPPANAGHACATASPPSRCRSRGSWRCSPRSAASSCSTRKASSPCSSAGFSASACIRSHCSSASPPSAEMCRSRSDTSSASPWSEPVIAIYHYQLEHVPNELSVCCIGARRAPCNVAVINIFGFISVPFLSMAAFLLITTLHAGRARQARRIRGRGRDRRHRGQRRGRHRRRRAPRARLVPQTRTQTSSSRYFGSI